MDCIHELCKKYDLVEDAPPAAPPRPAWCLEYDDSNVEDQDKGTNRKRPRTDGQEPPQKKRKKEYLKKNPIFMAGVPGVKAILDIQITSGIQQRVQDICRWTRPGFPGSQPVSMNRQNIYLLHEKPYRVSWKADGTRYMMLIMSSGEIYFIDRDNSIFQVEGLTFPHVTDCKRTLKDTLLDGVRIH